MENKNELTAKEIFENISALQLTLQSNALGNMAQAICNLGDNGYESEAIQDVADTMRLAVIDCNSTLRKMLDLYQEMYRDVAAYESSNQVDT